MKLDIVLNSEELVGEIQQRARENLKKGGRPSEKEKVSSSEPTIVKEPIPKTNTNEELAKLADTSTYSHLGCNTSHVRAYCVPNVPDVGKSAIRYT